MTLGKRRHDDAGKAPARLPVHRVEGQQVLLGQFASWKIDAGATAAPEPAMGDPGMDKSQSRTQKSTAEQGTAAVQHGHVSLEDCSLHAPEVAACRSPDH
ncbi:Hypothetical predicted protein [Pelobates cultripes]|uniref:Uncharacterized protein n=1 Tax=Pelobates cultripes TaxID=61616 RepID=A0AAD1R4Q9_PELCU|nr:Hypothetical predicted protein [Pelobates cultripes]